jgi:hypothetical protein
MLLPQALACDLLFHDPGLKAGAIHNTCFYKLPGL